VEKNTASIAKIEDNLGELQVKVNSLRAGGDNPDSSMSNDKIKKLSDEIEAVNKKVKEV
jgi:hypothetical protein